MNILVDINHPAHVHVFKNFAWELEKKGHKVVFTTLEKEVAVDLLKAYKFDYFIFGKNRKGLIKKIIQMFFYVKRLFFLSINKKIDIFVSHGSVYCSVVSFLRRKPHIAFEDTEHAKLNNYISHTFSRVILTPKAYFKDLGPKHIRYDGNLELTYLHPEYFKKPARQNSDKEFVIVRFVSWDATHDIGIKRISMDDKKKICDTILKYKKLIISSESEMPPEFEQYKFVERPEKMHEFLSKASLFVGEGGTMASECAVLGTPAVYINTLDMGYIRELQKYGLLFSKFKNTDEIIDQITTLLQNEQLKDETEAKSSKLIDEKIDVTAFMVWFIENYPGSFKTMKENSEYQYNFR